jgi:flavin reductase (DIM6/NTAB) family NADH-FMN oxidoreductase RutF
MSTTKSSDAQHALADLQSGLYVLSAQFEGRRAGVVVRSAQPCADEPPLLCVAVKRGHWIEPIIRDSHCFAISRINQADRLLLRKFAETARPRDGDPFDCLPTSRLVTGAPVIVRATLAIDCEVVRHFDLEADHELYIGLVVGARIGPGEVSVTDSNPNQPLLDLGPRHSP